MTAIITVGTSKGGAGKSTLCTNLIVQHANATNSNDCALIDGDPQKSATNWAAVRDSLDRAPGILSFQKSSEGKTQGAMTSGDFGTQVLRLGEKYPSIFIDVAGRSSPELRASMLISDLLILPLRPSNFDAWAFADDIGLIQQSRIQNPDLKVLVVYNAISTNPRAGASEIRDMDELLANEYPDAGLIIAKTKISSRSAFVKAAGEGAAVTELKPSADSFAKAQAEIRALYSEIVSLLNT